MTQGQVSILAVIALLSITNSVLWAQEQPSPEMLKAKEFFETSGIPGDKWVEGETMVPHVQAGKHFKASMLYYPGTEELQEDEVRVIFM